MLANILVFTFVGAFIAIVAFGHVLLIIAIWPDLSQNGASHTSIPSRRRKPAPLSAELAKELQMTKLIGLTFLRF